jgi:hypothetical protein
MDDNELVFNPMDNKPGLIVVQPSQTTGIRFKAKTEIGGVITLKEGHAKGLLISESYRTITP